MMSRRPSRPGIRRLLRSRLAERESVKSEVDEEILIHLALLAQELMREGWPEFEARHEAERRFGPLEARREELHRLAEGRRRSHQRLEWRSGLRLDLLSALRGAAKNPVLSLIAILVLGLGIGASTAVFSIFESVILRPLPYRDPSRLVVIWETSRAGSGEFTAGVFDNARDAHEWAARSRSFEGLAQATWATAPHVYRPEQGPPREVLAIPASYNFFAVLGVTAEHGRTFTRDDVANGCAVVLSNAFWRSAFTSDRGIIGGSISLNDARCTVLGVMPSSFEFYPRYTDLWSLMTPVTDTVLARHPDHYLVGVFARLRRGVSIADGQRELRAIHATGPEQSAFARAFTPTVFDLREEFSWLAGRNLHTTLVVLLGAVALVLVVVCVNIASLSLGRATARGREFAVRVAIGCGRWRLVRQLLIESSLLAGGGGLLGLAIASGGIRYVNGGSAIELPPGATARLDAIVLSATIAMTLFATLVVGILPAMRATRIDVASALKAASRGAADDRRSGQMGDALVLGQVSLSTMLLIAAGLLMQSLARLGSAPLGYTPDNLLTMRVHVASADTVGLGRTFADALERVRSISSVADAAWTSVVPVEGRGSVESIVVEGQPRSARDSIPDVGEQSISDEYFRVMQVPVLAGRSFTATDVATAPPVAIVNRAFVDRYAAGGDAIGRRIRFGGPNEPWLTVVGVAGNERRATVTEEMSWVSPPMVFRPMTQLSAPRTMLLVMRGRVSASSVAREAQRAVLSTSPDAVITDIASMHQLLERFLASPRTRAQALGALALLTLALAVIGLYGLLSQLVLSRTREIGIRVAMGALTREVVWLVIRRGILLGAAGVVLGGVLAFPAVRGMRALLYDVTTFDTTTVAIAALAMIGTAVIASAIPARRAAAVDPVIALRSD